MEIKNISGLKRHLWVAGGVLGTFLVGFSRLLNGLHSMEQIFLGWQLGVLQACIFHFSLRNKIVKLINKLTNGDAMPLSTLLFNSTLIYSASLASIILTYELVD